MEGEGNLVVQMELISRLTFAYNLMINLPSIFSELTTVLLICTAEEYRKESCEEESDIAARVLRWIMDITKAKIIELVDKFTLLMNEVFQPIEKEKPREETNHNVDDKVRSSLLLSIVILLIVVVARTRGA